MVQKACFPNPTRQHTVAVRKHYGKYDARSVTIYDNTRLAHIQPPHDLVQRMHLNHQQRCRRSLCHRKGGTRFCLFQLQYARYCCTIYHRPGRQFKRLQATGSQIPVQAPPRPDWHWLYPTIYYRSPPFKPNSHNVDCIQHTQYLTRRPALGIYYNQHLI
jgi:hypothetical protein